MIDNPHFKSGFISIIGRPNVGKSTLINQIIKEKLVITSDKPQTTRNAIRLIYTDESCQLIFIDTPGMHKPKNKLGTYMLSMAESTLSDVDTILFLVDPDVNIGPGDQFILEKIKNKATPIILLINKIDTLPKEKLLEVIRAYQSYAQLSMIIPVSAKTGDGIPELMEEIKKIMPEGPMYFPDDMIIDQSERFVLQELIREKVLNLLRDEIPHGVAVEITSMKARKGKNLIDLEATIFCEKKSHKGIIIGKQGEMLKKIGSFARRDMEFFMKTPINLQLWVKVRADWREKNYDLKDLGYSE